MIFATALRQAAGGLMAAALLFVSAVAGRSLADDPPFSLDLAAYRGKVVVIDFWASWCAPCRRSLPWLDAMQSKYHDQGLIVIGVNEDNVPEDAATFLGEVPVSFRIVPDENGDIAREFDLVAMPSTYIIGRDGKAAARHLGFRTAKQDEYEALLRSLLETGAASGESDE